MPAVAQTSVTATARGRGRVRVTVVDGPIQRVRLGVTLEGIDLTVHLSPREAAALTEDVLRALAGVREIDRPRVAGLSA